MNAAVIIEDRQDGIVLVNGKKYMADARGALVPLETVKAEHLLEDETVRKIMGYARELSDQIARFRGHTMVDLGQFDALLEQEHGGRARGGAKGNRTYMTFDGLMKVQVQVSDQIAFGPQLQIAKSLIDECLTEWSAESRPEIQAVVTRAFNTDKEGQVNRADVFMLMRLAIDDERWLRAMEALRSAIRVVGSKEYIRFYERDRVTDAWRPVTIDLAKTESVGRATAEAA